MAREDSDKKRYAPKKKGNGNNTRPRSSSLKPSAFYSEATLSLLFEALPFAAVLTDLEGTVTGINTHARKLMKTVAPKKGSSQKGTRVAVGEALFPAKLSRSSVKGKNRILELNTRNGSKIILSIAATPVVGSCGKKCGFVNALTDITELERQETELRNKLNSVVEVRGDQKKVISERDKFHHLINEGVDGIVWEADAETFMFTFVSKGAEKILGYPLERWKEKGFWMNNIYEDDRKGTIEYCLSCTRQLKNHEFEYRMIAADGRLVWLQDKVTVFSRRGQPSLLQGIMIDVTAKKVAEQSLNDTRKLFERLSSNVQGVIYNYDPRAGTDGKFEFISEGCADLLGVRSSDIMANASLLFGLIHRDDYTRVKETITIAVSTTSVWKNEFRIVTRNGQEKWIAGTSSPHTENDGRVLWYGFLNDVTELKNASRQLNLASFTVNQASDSVFWVRPDMCILDVNPRACSSLGYTREELVRLTVSDIDLGMPQNVWKDHWLELKQKKNMTLETVQRRKDGSLTDVEVSVNYIEFDGEEYICAFARNITARKEALQKLAASELVNRLIIENSGEGIFFTKTDGSIISANPEACKLLQYTEAEIISLGRAGIIDLNDPAVSAAIDARKSTGFVKSEVRMIRKDGSVLYADLTSRIFHTPDGQEKSTVIFRDITERKKLEDERNDFLTKFEKIAENVPGFIHQFRQRKDGTSHFLFASRGIHDVFGLKPEEVMEDASPVFKIIHPGDLENVTESIKASAEALTKWFAEFRICFPDGRVSWVEGYSTPQQLDDGSTIWYGYVQDITQRKQNEDTLLRQANEIRLKNEQLTGIAENIPRGAIYQFLVTADGKFSFPFISDGIERMVGLSPGKLAGDASFILKMAHPDDVTGFVAAVQKSAEKLEDFHHTTRFGIPAGGYRWLTGHSKPKKLADGSVLWEGVLLDETEKFDALESLARSESMFRDMARNVPGVVYRYHVHDDGSTWFSYVSERAHDLFGLSSDPRHQQWALGQMIPAEDRQAFIQSVADSVSSMKDWFYEGRLLCGDGSTKWFQGISRPSRLGDEVIFNGIMLDVTGKVELRMQLHQKYQELELANKRFNLAIRAGRLGIWEMNPSTMNLVSDSRCSEIFQDADVPYDQRIAHWLAHVHPEDLPKVKKILSDGTRENTDFTIVYRYRVPSGKEIYIETFGTIVIAEDGTRELIGVISDVTERIHSLRKVEESEARFRSLADSAPVLIWMAGLDKKCDYFNKGWLDFTGRSLEQEIGDGWTDRVHPDDLARCVGTFSSSFDVKERFEIEYRLQRFDGEYRWILDIGVPRFLPDGTFVGYVGSCFDIHESREFAARIQESENRFKLATKAANMGIWEWDITTGAIVWDDITKAMFGDQLRAGQKRLDYFLSNIHADDKPLVEHALDRAITANETYEVSFRWKRPDGVQISVETYGILKLDATGKPHVLTGLVMDVSEKVAKNYMLGAISLIQSSFIRESQPEVFFESALEQILRLTSSTCGLVAEVLYDDELPSLKVLSATTLDDGPAPVRNDGGELVVFNSQEYGELVEEVLLSERIVYAYTREHLQGKARLPAASFAGIPLRRRDKLVGVLCLANRPEGYAPGFTDLLSPLIETLSNIIEAYRGEVERQQFVSALELSEQRFKLGAKVARFGMYEWNVITNETYFDETARSIFQMEDTPEDEIFATWYQGIRPQDIPRIQGAMDRSVLFGEPHELVYTWKSPKGSEHVIHVNAAAKTDRNGKTVAVMGIARDVTGEYRAAEQLKESERRFRTMADTAPVLIWMSDESRQHTYFNKRYSDFTGRRIEQELGYGWKDRVHPDDIDRTLGIFNAAFDQRKPYQIEYRLRRYDGEYRWILSTGVPRYLNDNNFVGYIGSGIDISHQKQVEADLLAGNQEKEMLIKEIHHRVKNNLQLISSIIYFRMAKIEQSEAKEFLQNMRDRIRSIALIHERMLQTGSVSKVNMKEYIGKLLQDLHTSMTSNDLRVTMEEDIQSVTVDIDTAIYSGLIVNEMVTNAFKHGFKKGEPGRIVITYKRVQNTSELVIFNNGVPLPEDISPGASGSFGMQLLDIFIRQLRGTCAINRDNGTRFTVQW